MKTLIKLLTNDPSKHGAKQTVKVRDVDPNMVLQGRVSLTMLNRSDYVEVEYVFNDHSYFSNH